MNENMKKGILITVIVLALVAVAFTFNNFTGAETPVVVKTVGGPVTSEKDAALASQKSGAETSKGGEVDAGGG